MNDLKEPQARTALEQFLTTQLSSAVEVLELQQLTGGASRASWVVLIEVRDGEGKGRQRLVLRQDMGGEIQEQALSREQEFQLLQVAHNAEVLVPRPRWLCTDSEILGSPFFMMDFVPGESVGRRIVKDSSLAQTRKSLPQQMAEQLAKIHAIAVDQETLAWLPRPKHRTPAEMAIHFATRTLRLFTEPHPVLELALRWLKHHLPEPISMVLCHGDFRLGNLMVTPEGLASVLDWEFAHVGDPVEDIAWACVRSWRFGNDDLRLAGVGQPEALIEPYCALTNRPTSEIESRLQYWEIMGNFRWALGCFQQARRHLTGEAPSLELASLGRRGAEVEMELLDLLEQAESKS